MTHAALSSGQLWNLAQETIPKIDGRLAAIVNGQQRIQAFRLRELVLCASNWRHIRRLAGAGITGISLPLDLACEVDEVLDAAP